MHQFFICNPEDINLKLKSLILVKSSDDGWSDFLKGKNNDEDWLLTRYDSEYHGGGISILKRLPELTIDELIKIAITSDDKNNIEGASIELSQRESDYKEDFRNKLLDRLLQFDISKLSDFDKERFKIIIMKVICMMQQISEIL